MPKPLLHPLRKRADFQAASNQGKRVVTPAFILLVHHRLSQPHIRFGITASQKVGTAVDRNRAKRRLRALIREVIPSSGKEGNDYVLIARKACLNHSFQLMVKDLCKALEEVKQG